MKLTGDHAWVLITAFFLLFVAGLGTMVYLAERHKSAPVPIRTAPAPHP